MEMTIPVTLIVKAPNQQIEDQTVKCELSWTIHRLKGHLSEVYPSKPARDEQKLIYSGQLLSDTVVLKDVLRNYDGQDTHTVHLVCAPSRNYKSEQRKPRAKTETELPAPTTTETLPQPNMTVNTTASTSTSGLRQRTVPQNTQETTTDFQNMWTTISQPYGAIPNNQYALQAALIQQAYVNYINQYMQLVTNQQSVGSANAQNEPVAAGVVAPEPVNAAEAAAPEDADGDEPQPDRDWLDWFYVFSRVLVLFCIVYFYSSPLRFALVLLLGIGLYLYQMGFFRVQAVNNNEPRRPENNNLPPADAASGADTNQTNAPANAEQRLTMLNIMWTFFTTFFASLIPEIPNAI